MKSIFSTAYAAPIGYYKALLKSEVNLLEVHEHFIKQTIRNRCVIASANGTLVLTIPLSQRKNNMFIKDVCICYKTDWQRLHIKSLETAYKSSPFFEFYIDELKKAYQNKPEFLLDWNRIIHQQLLQWLKINTLFELSEEYVKVYENNPDFRLTDWNEKSATIYHQVFENKHGFIANLSIFDLLFNCGNQSKYIIS